MNDEFRLIGIEWERSYGLTSWRGFQVQRLEVELGQPGLTGDHIDELARAHLTSAELEVLANISSPKRRREWVGGRIAAKAMIIDHLWAGQPGAPVVTDLELLPDPHGRPIVALRRGVEPPCPIPEISISHTRELAVVALLQAAAGASLGVDIELIAERSPGFVKRVLTATELPHIEGRDDGAVQLALRWSLKEAAAKAIGMGFDELAPHEIEVTSLAADGTAELRFLGRAADRYARLGCNGLAARAVVHRDHSLAEVVIGKEVRPPRSWRRPEPCR
jgi:phosphopantetheine--protein transferase-like protein